MEILLVDGYNIIGAWPDLIEKRQTDFAGARDLLIAKMAEYQAFKGIKVIIVFDAHYVPGIESKEENFKVEIIFTKEKESADECIEKLANKLINVRTKVYVATSDLTEQWVIFGKGALRKSARELLTEMKMIEREITSNLKRHINTRPSTKIPLSKDVLEIFEKWRRE